MTLHNNCRVFFLLFKLRLLGEFKAHTGNVAQLVIQFSKARERGRFYRAFKAKFIIKQTTNFHVQTELGHITEGNSLLSLSVFKARPVTGSCGCLQPSFKT